MYFTRGSRLIWVCLCWVSLLSYPTQADSRNHIRHVELVKQNDGVMIEIVGEQAPNFTTFKQDSPKRVIVDIAECQLSDVPAWSRGNNELVKGIAVRQIGKMPDSIVRIMISLMVEAEYRVSVRENTLYVYLTPGTGGLLVSAGIPLGPENGALGMNKDGGFDTQRLANEIKLTGSASSSEMSAHDRALEGALSDRSHISAKSKPKEQRLTQPKSPTIVDSDVLSVKQTQTEQPIRPVLIAKADKEQESQPSLEDTGDEIEVEKQPREEISAEPVKPVLIAKADKEQESEPSLEDTGDEIEVEEQPREEISAESVKPVLIAQAQNEQETQPDLEDAGDEIEIEDQPEEVTPESNITRQPTRTEVEERVEISSALRHMTWLGFQQTSEFSRVFVKTNAPVAYRVNEEGENLVVLELDNTVIPLKNNRRFLDTHFFDSSVAMIVPREVGGVGQNVRIEIQLKQRVPFQIGREENIVYVNFERPK